MLYELGWFKNVIWNVKKKVIKKIKLIIRIMLLNIIEGIIE